MPTVSDPAEPFVELILTAFHRVHARIGPGFDREAYRNALFHELRDLGLGAAAEAKIELFYRGEPVGTAEADLAIGGLLIVSVEAARFLTAERSDRLARFVRAAGWEAGLLLNFGPIAEHWLVVEHGTIGSGLGRS